MIKKNLLSLMILDSIFNGNVNFIKIKQDIHSKQPLRYGDNAIRYHLKELIEEKLIQEIKSSASFYNLDPEMESEIKNLLRCFSKLLSKYKLNVLTMEIEK